MLFAAATFACACLPLVRLASATLFDGDLEPPGATENARLLHVSSIAAFVVAQVQARLPGALRALTPFGRDPLGQFEAAAEYSSELGSGYQLSLLIETNGEATTPTALTRSGLTSATAARLADAVLVPRLPAGAKVTVAGLGRVGAEAPPAPGFIDALRRFYLTLCHRSGAERCLVTSDVTPLGL